MKKIILILFISIFLRAGACAICSVHFGDLLDTINIGTILFECFCCYQCLRFLVSVFEDSFESKVQTILIWLKKIFVVLVALGCCIHFLVSLKPPYLLDLVLISFFNGIVLFAVFIIFELLLDIVFCLKPTAITSESSARDLLMQKISDYLIFFKKSRDFEKNDEIKAISVPKNNRQEKGSANGTMKKNRFSPQPKNYKIKTKFSGFKRKR